MTAGIEQPKQSRDRRGTDRALAAYAYWHLTSLSLVSVVAICSGCGHGAARVAMADFDPATVASNAISELDSNGDGILSADEIEESPGLMVSLSHFDQDGSGTLTAGEIEDCLKKWRGEKTGVLPYRCEVRWKGRPLQGATVRMVAESYFGDAIAEATGISDFAGYVDLSCSPDDLPEALKNVRAIRPGVYRIEVTHPTVDLPSKYNKETTLGQSVSLRNSNTLTLDLKP